ncbi:MAG: NAD(P)-dependent oxidoreductase [Flavobacteriales bacterium]|nr:NAD(P)-dependent oxidoreductase [Flavobacteriales bacterium]
MKISSSTKVYIAGCGGMLGQAVYKQFSAHANVKATDIDLNESWLEKADVRSYTEIRDSILSFQPDLIINLAALTDLEFCELNQENAWLTNALGAENCALVAREMNVPHVYISTAGIFDGQQEYYNDFDTPNPLGIYAKSKYYGERFVEKTLSRYYIFRAGWMMGGGEKKDKKFIYKIFKQLKAGQKELFVVEDKLGTPTYTKSFANGIFEIVQTGQYGLYNQVCNGDCSRYDVALEFVKLLGLENDITVTKVSSDHFKEDYFAPRPASEKLINMKLNARNLNFMPSWQEALAEYAKEFSSIQQKA